MGIWAHLRATKELAPGVTLKDLAAPRLRGDEERDRLASLYTARGWQLRRLGMVCLLVCAIAGVFLAIELVSLLPSIWRAKVQPDTSQIFQDVARNEPNVVLVWLAALVLAWLGFVGARARWWLAAPVLALVVVWFYDLTGGFPGRHHALIGQVGLAFAIALFATGQGMIAGGVRRKKREEQRPSGVHQASSP